jgi:hypothetical protein
MRRARSRKPKEVIEKVTKKKEVKMLTIEEGSSKSVNRNSFEEAKGRERTEKERGGG